MSALVAAARSYLGAPFHHMGRSPLGMDCAGLLVLAERDCGRILRDVAKYGREPWKDGLHAALVDNYGLPVAAAPVSAADLQPGDKLLMRFTREPQHIAIVTDYLTGGLGLIHTRSDIVGRHQRGRVVETRLAAADLASTVAVFR